MKNKIYLDEKLTASDPTSKWISDFVKSDNPKFVGKDKKERIRMALGASYAAKGKNTNEEIDLEEKKKGLWDNIHAKRKRGERAAKPGEKGYPKTLNIESAYGRINQRFKDRTGRTLGDAAKEHGEEAKRLQKEIDAQQAENERRKAAMKKEEVEPIDEISLDLAKRARDKAAHVVDMDYDDLRMKPFGHSEKQRIKFQKYVDKKEAQKNVKEETEQIDELSKGTLASYAKKAVSDARFKQGIGKDYEALGKRKRDADTKSMFARMGRKVRMKAQSREAGVGKAIDRLAKEEVELDEISKKTLGSYVNKASVDMANRTAEGERKRTLAGADYAHNISRGMSAKTADADMKKDYAAAKPDVKKSVKRMYGISKAVGRLTKEETGQNKNDLPFKSDSKSNKPIAKPGRFGIGPSTAKHLAQMAMQKQIQIDKKSKPVTEDEQRMSRAAKGHEKYGKVGMQALAKAGRDGASEKTLDKIRNRHNKYNESLDEAGRMRGGGKDPCWKGYKMVGTKKKAGREVPNCVPTEEVKELKTFKALREEINGN